MVKVHNEPSLVTADHGQVDVDGPNGAVVSLTPSAALSTGKKLVEASVQASNQRCLEEAQSVIVEFTLTDGNPVSINLDRLDYFQPSDEGTSIVLADGVSVTVTDSYDAVAEVMNPERQAGC